MGPMASSTAAYKRGGQGIPGRPAELPKGGVSDTSITCSGIHRRGMQSVRRVGFGFSRRIREKRPRPHPQGGRNCENESRKASKSLAVKVFVRPSMHGA